MVALTVIDEPANLTQIQAVKVPRKAGGESRVKAVSFLVVGGLVNGGHAGNTEDHQVQMLNKVSAGRAMQFEPAFLKLGPDDMVAFLSTSTGHNSESILTLMPEAAGPWMSKVSEEIAVNFDTKGCFTYKFQPHLGMGMIGLIQVGDAPVALDPAQVEELPKCAADRLTELTASARKAGVYAPSKPEAPTAQ